MRLLRLHLLAPDLSALHHFYTEVLQLPAYFTADALRIRVGFSELCFVRAPAGAAPYYHFAFHVAAPRLDAAFGWLRARTPVLPFTDGQPLADFPNWQARAFYFHDPAGNILECIARDASASPAPNDPAPFSATELPGLSEAGLVTPRVLPTADLLTATHGIRPYHRGPRRPDFTALGDDEGLLIVNQTGRGWLPTGRPAEVHWLRVEGEQVGQSFMVETDQRDERHLSG